ncbi:MAG: hypothetical protein COV57_01620 [Candidatus Liptonbacteria bacterium CG11_big_fil_rev_8_21_14_0_20_35_14]|uniref:HTH deoR-type domain-containing protein n=1 Tax=Candidatus Liptonbacteria bacterium CG11_big_fil_rev_8_21_14_0_20_35_14 TaxID=1974634 RepID=A0A2H0N7X1_9BACT|nr:MAG: hypothetical protein COV57_01620 [Candidatus Liptonbacteria bacterium CG11_big_fil_rev_8_21_14_0_20_35_14]
MTQDLLEEVANLSYVLFRVAETIENDYLRDRIKMRSIDLIESSMLRSSEEFLNHSGILRQLVSLAYKLNHITEKNKNIIVDKIYDFEYVLIPEERGSFNAETVFTSYSEPEVVDDDFDIALNEEEEVFEDEIVEEDTSIIKENNSAINNSAKSDIDLPNDDVAKEDEDSDRKRSKADVRRDLVLEKVKKEGICFIRDLMASFPDYSERTLRYDLESLIEEGKIEKIGNSGPGTFYRSL